MSFLNDLLESTKELESPRSFWYWSGLATISAIVKDNLWLNRGDAYKLYPNIYVMLYAVSGLRKGPPVALAKTLVTKVNNTRIISGRSSIQGILKELGTAQTQPGGKVNAKSVAFIVASEFTSSLVNDPAAMTILTDLYDRHYNEGDYKSLLKMESFQLKDPTLTMLVATNDAHFDDFVGQKDIQGGFIGRTFVIAEEEVNKLNSLAYKLDNPPKEENFIPYLKQLSTLKGEMHYGPGADKRFDDWYMDFYSTIAKSKVKDETGTIQRFGDSVLKVAMLTALARAPDLIVTIDDIDSALKESERFIKSVRKTTLGKKGKSSLAFQKALIITELLEREGHQATRSMLMRKHWMHFGATELDEIMLSLEQAGLVTMEARGSQIVYMVPDDGIEHLIEYMKGKK